MGWLFSHRNAGEPLYDFLVRNGHLSWVESSEHTYKVLDHALVKMHTLYAAVEKIHKVTGVREVFAIVDLIYYAPQDYYNTGVKDMDEFYGPCECACPERILKLLTPTDNAYAKEWRERCWARINARKSRPKLIPGMELEYGGHRYRILQSLGRRGQQVLGLEDGLVYRMRPGQVAEASIL